MELWSAFLIGLAGSLHCAGMCGALLIALPVNSPGRLSFLSGRILYNAGRIATYIILGMFFGAFGSAAGMFGFQQNVSVLLGTVVILFVVMPRDYRNKVRRFTAYEFINKKLQLYFGMAMKKNSLLSMLFFGMLNGLLPCGMVYAGLAGAISFAGSTKGSMIYMALFGLGTLPMMFTVSLMGRYIGIGLRRKLNRMLPLLAFLLGVVFILRGMNLGIPYVSPKLSTDINHMHMRTIHTNSFRSNPAGMNPASGISAGQGCCR